MNLVDLVNFRNSLQDGVSLDSLNQEFDKVIKQYQTISQNVDPEFLTATMSSIENFSTLQRQLEKWHPAIQETIDQLNAKISTLSQKFFTSNYAVELELKEKEFLTQNLRNKRYWRNIKINDLEGPDAHMLGVIQKNVTYQYPVLEIGCRDGEWTKYLVAGDPLYLAEYTEELLESAVSQFTKQYIQRVRRYLVENNDIKGLPTNQFNFIFSYNFFNYLAFDTIKEWMKKAHIWLRPGGIIMFTYNNADYGYGAGMAESGIQSYCPMSLLVPMCESVGLEYHDHKDYISPNGYNPFSWIQFKKPGELKTIKVGQALGKINRYDGT